MTKISPEPAETIYPDVGASAEEKVITPLGQVIKARQTAKCEIVVRLNLKIQNLSLGFYLHVDKRRQGEGK